MIVSVSIYKEKKEKDFRMIILPSGRSEIGLIQMKDYGIISYLGRGEEKKIGELVLWALEQRKCIQMLLHIQNLQEHTMP